MSFPISPTNNQTTVLNGITYQYNSANSSWTRVPGVITATTTLIISGTTPATSTNTGALQVYGGVGIGGALWVGTTSYIAGAQILTTATFQAFNTGSVSLIIAGTDTSINSSTGVVTIWNTSTLQTITSRGSSTTYAVSITNTNASTSTTTGALTVSGGIGVGGSVYVGGNTLQVGSGPTGLIIQPMVGGSYGAIYSTNIVPSTTNYTFITDGASPNFNGTNGVFFNVNNVNKLQVYPTYLNITPTTASTSTTTGALVVAGGVGIGGALYVGNTVSATNITVTGSGSSAGNNFLQALIVPNGGIGVANNSFFGGTVGFGAAGYTGAIMNIGYGLGQMYLSTNLLGFQTVNTTTTLQIGVNNSFNNGIKLVPATGDVLILNTTSSTSTTTGALQVVGGVGIGGALYVGGNAYIGSTVTSGFILGTISGFNSSYSVIWPTAISTPSTSNYGLAIGASDVLINSNARITLGANTANTFRVQSGTPSYTAASGQSTVILSGGLGVTGDSFVNGALGIGSTTSSMSTTTGALIVAGGVGIGGSVYVGNRVGWGSSTGTSVAYQFYNQATGSMDMVFG